MIFENIKTLPACWWNYLGDEFSKPYMKALQDFLKSEREKQTIYPDDNEIFSALNFTPFDKVKVIILGQDPYHGPKQAHGLAFSVRAGVKVPPSLANIYKELADDLNLTIPSHGNLENWAKQGVLLLNSIFTVAKNSPASHKNRGWEILSDKILEVLNNEKKSLVFILWGNYAKEKGHSIDRQRHLVLTAPHPSPFSARRGFFKSRPFSQANKYLIEKNIAPINWRIE